MTADTYHACNGGPTESEDGFYEVNCTCGAHACGFPDAETAIDFLMEHAYEMGRLGK